MTTVPLAKARADLSRMVEEAVSTHARVEITRNGSRAAVLMSADDYDTLLETLDVLANADLVRDLRESAEEAHRGEVFSTQDVLEGMRAAGRDPRP